MSSRRQFVATALGFVVLPVIAAAQETKELARIGWLSPLSAVTSAHIQETLRDRLHGLGRVEGKNLAIENRYAEGDATRLPELASELARLRVDVIVAGSTPAAIFPSSNRPGSSC